MQMMFPEEIEVWYVLPALRKEIAKELRKLGLPSTEIAKKLGITKAAVSQYLSGKRGLQLKFDKETRKMINTSAKVILNGSDAIPEIKKISKHLIKNGFICKLHRKYANVPSKCDWCSRI